MNEKLKRILLISICVALISCQKEYLDNPKFTSQESRLKMISLSGLNSKIRNSKDYNKLSALFDANLENLNQQSKDLNLIDNPYLITDEIAMIEKENMAYYTFKIGKDSLGDEFYNLVVAIDNNGNILSARILEYIPSVAWLQDKTKPFSGSVKANDNDIFSNTDIVTSVASKSSSRCLIDASVDWECTGGYERVPNPSGIECQGWGYVINVRYGPCPPHLISGEEPDDPGIPVNTGGGSGGSGGSAGDNEDDCEPSLNNPCDEDETTPLTINDPEQDCENEISGLSEIINTPKIKTELDRLKTGLASTALEDGKRFEYTGTNMEDPSTYNDSNFNEILPIEKRGDGIYFPVLQNNTLIGAHFHPDFDIDLKRILKIPSPNDVAEHINMVKKVYETNPNAANQVTNFIISNGNNGRTYILRANNAQNIVNNTKDYTKDRHKENLAKKLIKKLNGLSLTDYNAHESAFNSLLTEEFPDLEVYKAEYDTNNNITKFCKL